MNYRQRRGFARGEMLIVLGAGGLLTALWLPVTANNFNIFGRARENARRATCQSNLRQIALGLTQYALDYDETYPPATASADVRFAGFGWAEVIQPYLRNTQIYQCPGEKHPAQQPPQPRQAGYIDYWYNARFSRLTSDKIVNAARTLTMGDGDGGAAASTARYNLSALPASWKTIAGSPATRHLSGANYAFADGHVKWLMPDDISSAPLRPSGDKATFALR